MKIKQLSVFLENRAGRLSAPCQTLAEAGLNILTLSLADTREFGILRLVLREWEEARDALTAAGYTVTVTDVVAIEVADRPGGLAEVLQAIERQHLDVEYMYAFAFRTEDRAVLVFRFADADAAAQRLQEAGLNVVGDVELFQRAGE